MSWTTALAPGQDYPHHICFAVTAIHKSCHWREWVVLIISYPGKPAAQLIVCFDKHHTATLVLLCHPDMPWGWIFPGQRETMKSSLEKKVLLIDPGDIKSESSFGSADGRQ